MNLFLGVTEKIENVFVIYNQMNARMEVNSENSEKIMQINM